ncbi:unnamed protein product [Prunus brigantina]
MVWHCTIPGKTGVSSQTYWDFEFYCFYGIFIFLVNCLVFLVPIEYWVKGVTPFEMGFSHSCSKVTNFLMKKTGKFAITQSRKNSSAKYLFLIDQMTEKVFFIAESFS